HDDPWILHGEKRPVLHAAKESPGPGISPQLNPIDPPPISEKNRVARNSPNGRTDHHGLRRTTSPEPGQAPLGDAADGPVLKQGQIPQHDPRRMPLAGSHPGEQRTARPGGIPVADDLAEAAVIEPDRPWKR